jgi:UDP-2,3-diacylglucosamine pyrophosphatase LpxH
MHRVEASLFLDREIAMNKEPRMKPTCVRSIFVSDVHLGCRYAQAEALLSFLMQHNPEYVYLVGDVIDGWQLKRRWHWRSEYNQIFHRLLELARRGTRICYAPGNHDSFLRHFLQDFGLVEVADQFIHQAADDSRYLVLHGDQFDNVELRAPWLSVVGGIAYDVLLWADRQINGLRRWFGWERRAYSARIKARVKGAVRFVSRFEDRLARHAQTEHCDGVICGHIHTPTITRHKGFTYCNTGDWIENCSALVEHSDGRMQILQFGPDVAGAPVEKDAAAGPETTRDNLPQITAA